MSLLSVPLDIFLIIFNFLKPSDIPLVCTVNKALYKIATSDRYWQPVIAPLLNRLRLTREMPWQPIKNFNDGWDIQVPLMDEVKSFASKFKKREEEKLAQEVKMHSSKGFIPLKSPQLKLENANLTEHLYKSYIVSELHGHFLLTNKWRNLDHIVWNTKNYVTWKDSIKILLMGCSGTGMTSLVLRKFEPSYTQDTQITQNTVDIINQKIWQDFPEISVWDACVYGEDGSRLRSLSYFNTQVYLICFPLNNQQYFDLARNKWALEATMFNPTAVIILVGTKCDLRKTEPSENLINWCEGIKMAKAIGAAVYMECSAHLNVGIDEIFREVKVLCTGEFEEQRTLLRADANKKSAVFNNKTFENIMAPQLQGISDKDNFQLFFAVRMYF